MDDKYMDALLNINTGGFSEFAPTFHYFRYEATSYQVLNELLEHFPFTKNDRFVDFGCGKGRTLFFIHHFLKLPAVGIEMDAVLFRHLEANYESYFHKHKGNREDVSLFHGFAEEYPIDRRETIFYFFNPFSVQIFIQVVHNILDSYLENKRDIHLILYYPSRDYIYFLERQTPFRLVKEIPVTSLYEQNDNERLLIYRLQK